MNKKLMLSMIVFAAIGTIALIIASAGSSAPSVSATDTTFTINGKTEQCTKEITFGQGCTDTVSEYEQNLNRITSATYRNSDYDNSPFIGTPSDELPLDQLYTSYLDYYTESRRANGGFLPGLENAGQFRVVCEFSHFAYDDPIVFPGEPGQSHLHMFFGNTHANAESTYDTLINSGSSTCNGREANRTSYWVPALLDQNGDARIPDRLLVYYKAYKDAVGSTAPYPAGMALVSGNAMANGAQPGTQSFREIFFRCFNGGSASDNNLNPKSATIPRCTSGQLEMNVKFQTCWNGKNPSNYKDNASFSNVWPTSGECPSSHPINLPQMEYRIFWSNHNGQSNKWILSSDVDIADESRLRSQRGHTIHGDWWGGWNKEVNQAWIDGCVNTYKADCDGGLLADARQVNNPPALIKRKEYTGPMTIPGATLLSELCNTNKSFSGPYSTALCDTTTMRQRMGLN